MQHRASAEVVVPISRKVIAQPDGTTSTEISLDLKEVPIPERRYVADAAWVDIRNEIVRIMFGQRGTVGDHLRSLIVVNVFPEPTRNLVETSKDFIALYEEFLNRNKMLHAGASCLDRRALTNGRARRQHDGGYVRWPGGRVGLFPPTPVGLTEARRA